MTYPTYTCPEEGDCPNHLDIEVEPGDVLVDSDGYRQVVRWVDQKRDWKSAACGCCSDSIINHYIYVDGEPQTVILAGGGTALVPTLESYVFAWPPHKLIRDGVILYEAPSPPST